MSNGVSQGKLTEHMGYNFRSRVTCFSREEKGKLHREDRKFMGGE